MKSLIKAATLVALVVGVVACSHTAIKGESGDKKASMKTYGMDSTGVIVTDGLVEIQAKKSQKD